MKKILLIYLTLLANTNLFAQKDSIIECNYLFKIVKGTDTTKYIKRVVITNSNISDYNNFDTLKASFYDFEKNIHVLYNPKTRDSHSFNLKENRVSTFKKEDINSKDIQIIVNREDDNVDTVTFDKTVNIPCFKGGNFADYLDNGIGFLPIKLIRHYYSKKDEMDVLVIATLESKLKKPNK